MPAEYNRDGVQFLYPENWSLDMQAPNEGILCAVSLESPSGAIWSLNVEAGERDNKELADKILKTMQEEYDQVEEEPFQGQIGPYETTGYELHFYCVELIVKAVIQCFHANQRTFMVMTQAETRDHDELEAVFAAISASLAKD